jgi:hypothetical protein
MEFTQQILKSLYQNYRRDKMNRLIIIIFIFLSILTTNMLYSYPYINDNDLFKQHTKNLWELRKQIIDELHKRGEL